MGFGVPGPSTVGPGASGCWCTRSWGAGSPGCSCMGHRVHQVLGCWCTGSPGCWCTGSSSSQGAGARGAGSLGCWCTGRMVPRVLVHSVPAPRAPARGVPAHPRAPRVPVGSRGLARRWVSQAPAAHTGFPSARIARLARLRPRVLVHRTGIGGLRCVVPACCCLPCNRLVRRTSPRALHGGGCVVALHEHVWHGWCSLYACCTAPGVAQACVARQLLNTIAHPVCAARLLRVLGGALHDCGWHVSVCCGSCTTPAARDCALHLLLGCRSCTVMRCTRCTTALHASHGCRERVIVHRVCRAAVGVAQLYVADE